MRYMMLKNGVICSYMERVHVLTLTHSVSLSHTHTYTRAHKRKRTRRDEKEREWCKRETHFMVIAFPFSGRECKYLETEHRPFLSHSLQSYSKSPPGERTCTPKHIHMQRTHTHTYTHTEFVFVRRDGLGLGCDDDALALLFICVVDVWARS